MLIDSLLIAWSVSANAQQNKITESHKTSGYAPVNGIKMYYEIYGKGDIPLVLIHGGGSTIESSFSNLIPLLSGKIIAVELQAHGRTNDRNAPETFEQDAMDVAGLLKHLNIEKANVLGFSNGGTTTLQLAIKYPKLLNKIVVISGTYKREGMITGFFDGMEQATIDNMPEALKTAYLKVNPSQDGLINMFNKDKSRMINFKDYQDDDLKNIKAPALIMVADHDVVTPEHTIKISKFIQNAQLAILPGTHGSFIGEVCSAKEGDKATAITASLIDEFLKD
ncbi:alpha/beta hydrolase [Pedobacter yonginense]|uniref:Alpha/beta hydrolase n=2 Tax=Pedobacter yonginense TaxID=651869 RepID=A0A317EL51_9SPHI|nr:alpha/beta hydrolase [Pedobacter yonginense]